MGKWLRRFWPRLLTELNRIAGLGGLGVASLAVAAFFSSGTLRAVLIAAGIIVVTSTAVIAILRSLPPRMMSPAQAEGKELILDDLRAIDPPVPTIGIIGPEMVGKTTLRNLLLQVPEVAEATQRVTAHVSSIIKSPTTFVAILDGRGETYRHQFEVADAAEILCVMMDHHIVEGETKLSHERVARHTEFGEQVRRNLVETWPKRGSGAHLRVHILLNKRDKWEKAADEDQGALHALVADEASKWSTLGFVGGVSTANHTNVEAKDIALTVVALKEHWSAIQKARTAE